jgi:hypothetical protein
VRLQRRPLRAPPRLTVGSVHASRAQPVQGRHPVRVVATPDVGVRAVQRVQHGNRYRVTHNVTVRVTGSTVGLPPYVTRRLYDRAWSFGSVTVTRPLESSVTVRRT